MTTLAAGTAVLFDANCIIEAHRTKCWRALAGHYRIETVDDVFAETGTGQQNRAPEHNVDQIALRGSLKAIHSPSLLEKMTFIEEYPSACAIHDGERALWTHAFSRKDEWLFCGPDKGSMMFALNTGHRERLVSMSELVDRLRYKPNPPLQSHYKKAWLDQVVAEWLTASGNMRQR